MKKQILLAAIVSLGLASISGPVFAGNDHWFDKYDHNHDGKWSYEEYCAWQKAHHRHLSDRQLHEMYDQYDANHDGFWQREEAHRYH